MPIVDLTLWQELVLMELCDIKLFCEMWGVEFGLEPLTPAVLATDCDRVCVLDDDIAEEFTDRHYKIESASAPMHDPYSSWQDFVAAWGMVIMLELDSVKQFLSYQQPDHSGDVGRHVQ